MSISAKRIGGVAIAVLVASTAASTQGPVFRAGVDLVNIGVTVTDRKGTFVEQLGAEDFEIYEDGRKQEIRHFVRGDSKESAPELHVGLLFDTSGSMRDEIDFARSAAVKFLNQLNDAVDITLVDFDTEVRVTQYRQADFARLIERIRVRKPDGFTALYDALGVYLDGAADQAGRKILVIYTDGGDTRSALNFPETVDLLKASDVTVYAIGFAPRGLSAPWLERTRLSQLADLTGGLAHFPATIKDLVDTYAKIESEIHAQYGLGYLSTNERADGRWRKVEVRIRGPKASGLKIRTRQGYFAPYTRTR
jgi:Ca-activated chloride channel family protein